MTEQTVKLKVNKVYGKKIQEVVQLLINHKKELGIQEVWLFGSVARGDYSALSDIDLMVITDFEEAEVSNRIERLELRDDTCYPKIDIVVKALSSLQDKKYDFNRYVLRDKIVLWRCNPK